MSWRRCSTIGVKTDCNRRQAEGFSLIEVMVSVLIFVIIILSATQIFKMVIDGQRSAIASQNVQESLKYFLEVTAKEIRTAKKSEGVCVAVPADQIFSTSTNAYGEVLNFRNYYGECVEYKITQDASTTNRFFIRRTTAAGYSSANYISPRKINIDKLHFTIRQSSSTQPVVTINLTAHALEEAQFKSEMDIQTTISSRYYK